MKKRILLTMLLIIFAVSSFTLFLIVNYMNPYSSYTISMIAIITTSLLSSTSFLTLFLYFFKKVYYRWEIFLGHIFSSLRQAFLLTAYVIWLIIFNRIWVISFETAFLAFLILVFIELLVQNLMYKE
jgi:multisubunit Na+/H+ antiporter MnhC subunit